MDGRWWSMKSKHNQPKINYTVTTEENWNVYCYLFLNSVHAFHISFANKPLIQTWLWMPLWVLAVLVKNAHMHLCAHGGTQTTNTELPEA